MAAKTYGHSAYWYAYHKGWTYSEAKTLAGKYLDMHSYRPRNGGRGLLALCGGDAKLLDSSFNPLLFCACAMVDIGKAMRDEVAKFADPVERGNMKRNLMRDLRRLRRPFYYARETERRRALAAARRKLARRTTAAAMPSPEDILAAWNARKDSREAMIRLGGMLHDLECFVDNRLRIAEDGQVVGRNGGIRGWIKEVLPELAPKYKTLMRYKALAVRLRQATETKDPKPTAALLDESPRHEVVEALLADPRPVFSGLFAALEHMVSPETVLLDAPKSQKNLRTSKERHSREKKLNGKLLKGKNSKGKRNLPSTQKKSENLREGMAKRKSQKTHDNKARKTQNETLEKFQESSALDSHFKNGFDG